MNDRNLDFVEKEILKGKSVQVFLAGDVHHYRRHEAKDGTQKITAGGGGAFLHPTHGWNVNEIVETLQPTQADAARTFHHKASWPSPSVSRQLSLRNGLFPLRELEIRHSTGQSVLTDGMVRHGERRRDIRLV